MEANLEAAELIDERPDEQLDTSRLEPYLRERLEGVGGPLRVRQFGGGDSSLLVPRGAADIVAASE